MANKGSDRPQGRWREVRALGDRNVGQAWLYVVTDTLGEYEGEYVYKVLKNITQSTRRKRFALEIEVTNVLAKSGLSVVRVVDSGVTSSDRPYMVTPFYPRGDLRVYAESAPFANKLAPTLEFVTRLAQVVKQVHETAAHRDLKPENILIDVTGRPVLCDFGLCLPLWDSDDATRNSHFMEQVGSRHYMAPEALAGFPLVKNPLALDVYSVGKIAYELGAGRVLPGIALPTDEYDLAAMHPGSDDWYLFNAAIRGLVDHDPSTRMNTWQRLPSIIEQAQTMSASETIEEVALERFQTRIARGIEASNDAQEAKRIRDFHAKSESYIGRLVEVVTTAFSSNARIQRLRHLATNNDGLEVAINASSSDLITRLPGYPTENIDLVRDGTAMPSGLVRLRIGKTPSDDPMPSLSTDLTWRHDLQDMRLTFALYVARFGPPSMGGIVAATTPVPEVVALEWAALGDEAYVVQARLMAAKMADRFADLVDQTLDPPRAA